MAERAPATTPHAPDVHRRDDIPLAETHGVLGSDKLAAEDARNLNRAEPPASLTTTSRDRSFTDIFRTAVAIQVEDFRSFQQGVAQALESPNPRAALKEFLKVRFLEFDRDAGLSFADLFEDLAKDMREAAARDSLQLAKVRGPQ